MQHARINNRSRTIIISALIYLSGFFIINYVHFKMEQKVFTRTLTESVLPAQADSVAETIGMVREKYSLATRLIAGTIDVSLFRSNGREDPKAVIEFVQKKRDELGVRNVGFVSLETDTYYDSLGRILKLDYTTERDRWVQDFLDAPQKEQYSLYDPEDYVELYSFYFDSKVTNAQGEVAGIFGTGISLETLSRSLETGAGHTRMLFADRKGQLRLPLEYRGESFFEKYNVEKSADNEDNLSDNSFFLTENRRLSGTDRPALMLYLRFIPEIDRFLIVEHDISHLHRDLQRQGIITFAAGTLFALIIVGINFRLMSKAGRKLSIKGFTDPLTESYNRHFLEEYFGRKNSAIRQICLMALDVDHFKQINDNMGHPKGDQILKEVSRLAKSQIRDNDFIVRWGGDEFIVVVHAGICSAVDISERIRAAIEEGTTVTVTIGVVEMKEIEDFSTALSRADEAMYIAKHEGRNKVHCGG